MMSTEVEAQRNEAEQIVRELETVYDYVQTRGCWQYAERTGVLNSLRVMREPASRAAKLLRETR